MVTDVTLGRGAAAWHMHTVGNLEELRYQEPGPIQLCRGGPLL